ncbi:MAG: hypothetical protein J7L94_03095, partial [Caldisericaceae bacterium]|nr:hypothetical protein [Caldisericaceae bacterium]
LFFKDLTHFPVQDGLSPPLFNKERGKQGGSFLIKIIISKLSFLFSLAPSGAHIVLKQNNNLCPPINWWTKVFLDISG